MTKDEIIQRIAGRLFKKGRDSLTFAEVGSIIQALPQVRKDAIVSAIQRNDRKTVGDIIVRAVQSDAKSRALADATSMLTDDSLNLTEIERIL